MNRHEPPKITFEEDQWRSPARNSPQQMPNMVRWVIKHSGGYIKDRRQAEYVLLGFVAIAVFISLVLIFSVIR
jgi:hypothetical protein